MFDDSLERKTGQPAGASTNAASLGGSAVSRETVTAYQGG